MLRNSSQHSCALQPGDGVAFGDYRHGHSIYTKECRNCDSAGNQRNISAIKLEVGASARLVATWETKPVEGGLSCQEGGTVFGPKAWNIWAVSLLGDICSIVHVDSHLPDFDGHKTGAAVVSDLKHQPIGLSLSSSGVIVYSGDSFWLHVAIEDRDAILPLDERSCPVLFLRSRASSGTTSFQEKSGQCQITPIRPGPGRLIRIDMATMGWGLVGEPGESTVEAFALVGDPHAAQVKFVSSNLVNLRIVNPATIARRWGPETKGLAISLFLDKDEYPIGEDIPLRMAVKNFSADAAIASGELPCSAGFSFDVHDSAGRINQSDYPMGCTGHGWRSRYPKGKAIPVSGMTMRSLGLLPKEPGEYTLSASWKALSEEDQGTTNLSSDVSFSSTPLVPYATVRSTPVKFRITRQPPEN